LEFNDEEKYNFFLTKIYNVLNGLSYEHTCIDFDEYYTFCSETGSSVDPHLSEAYSGQERFQHCIKIISSHRKDIKDFLAYYIWFSNSIKEKTLCAWKRDNFINLLKTSLEESHIQYDAITIDDKVYVFPKGAKELDDALVSEPLAWLESYPKARRTYIIALKQYSDGTYIRDVADNLRKSLETFFQEFLGNTKNLESNKTEIYKYLAAQDIDGEIAGMFQPLINTYKNVNDRFVKHNDLIDEKLIEFLLYQTGIFIRMVLSVHEKSSEK